MKPASAVRELWVGLLLAVAFVVFFVILISVGEQHNLLSPKDTYHARFTSTQGLAVGAPVRLEGVPVGSVTDIQFPEDPDDFHIIVTFQVDRKVAPRIRQDTTAILVSQGLIGEVLLGLERGTPETPPAEPGSFLPVKETGTLEEFKSQGQIIAENMIQISADIRSILKKIDEGQGLAARLLSDQQFADEFLDRINSTMASIQEVTASISHGDSFLGQLLSSDNPRGAEAAASLFESIEGLDAVVGRLREGKGTLGRLLNEDEQVDRLISDLSQLASSLRGFAHTLEEKDGLLKRLTEDEELGRRVAEDLQSASDDLAAVMDRLEKGEGTVGALLADPSIYEGLRDLVGGIQKSRVLRWFIHRKVKKGAEEGLQDRAVPPEKQGEQAAPRRRRGR